MAGFAFGASRLTVGPSRAIMTSMLATARAARHLVFVVAFALAFGSVATCLAAVLAAEPAMVCHGTEQHPASGDSARLDCCPGEAPNTQGSNPVQLALDTSAPTPVLVAVLPLFTQPQFGIRAGTVDAGTGTPKPPGIATYVLISSFRI